MLCPRARPRHYLGNSRQRNLSSGGRASKRCVRSRRHFNPSSSEHASRFCRVTSAVWVWSLSPQKTAPSSRISRPSQLYLAPPCPSHDSCTHEIAFGIHPDVPVRAEATGSSSAAVRYRAFAASSIAMPMSHTLGFSQHVRSSRRPEIHARRVFLLGSVGFLGGVSVIPIQTASVRLIFPFESKPQV